jgi:hypothetical protein
MRVVCAIVSIVTANTRLTVRSAPAAPETISTLSPRRTFAAVPRTVTCFVAAVGSGWRCVSSGRIALNSSRPVIASIVSNTCGSSPGPGMLCTRVPAGTGMSSTELVASSVNARSALAATPGRGT